MDRTCFLTRTSRPRRAGEWSSDTVVTFIVNLAATQNVTLAARASGMSRKSAYALRHRDPAFAAAWAKALAAGQGNKVDEVDDLRNRQGERHSRRLLRRRMSAANLIFESLLVANHPRA